MTVLKYIDARREGVLLRGTNELVKRMEKLSGDG